MLVAAVADWRVEAAPAKLKKADGPPQLDWSANPDILADLAAQPAAARACWSASPPRPRTSSTPRRRNAQAKGCDWIVANDVSGDVMGGDANQVHLITADGVESWEQRAQSGSRAAARRADRRASRWRLRCASDWLLLTPLARFGDLGLLLLRWVTGAFLV